MADDLWHPFWGRHDLTHERFRAIFRVGFFAICVAFGVAIGVRVPRAAGLRAFRQVELESQHGFALLNTPSLECAMEWVDCLNLLVKYQGDDPVVLPCIEAHLKQSTHQFSSCRRAEGIIWCGCVSGAVQVGAAAVRTPEYLRPPATHSQRGSALPNCSRD